MKYQEVDSNTICQCVAPLAGARIEMMHYMAILLLLIVAPLAGARIEIVKSGHWMRMHIVAPLAGARIEIGFFVGKLLSTTRSLPSRERGLK